MHIVCATAVFSMHSVVLVIPLKHVNLALGPSGCVTPSELTLHKVETCLQWALLPGPKGAHLTQVMQSTNSQSNNPECIIFYPNLQLIDSDRMTTRLYIFILRFTTGLNVHALLI